MCFLSATYLIGPLQQVPYHSAVQLPRLSSSYQNQLYPSQGLMFAPIASATATIVVLFVYVVARLAVGLSGPYGG